MGERDALDAEDPAFVALGGLRVADHHAKGRSQLVGGLDVTQRRRERLRLAQEDLAEAVHDRRGDEVLAVAEVAVEQGDGDPGLRGDPFDPELRQSIALDFQRRGFQDPVTRHLSRLHRRVHPIFRARHSSLSWRGSRRRGVGNARRRRRRSPGGRTSAPTDQPSGWRSIHRRRVFRRRPASV